jgi:hypothetical protein
VPPAAPTTAAAGSRPSAAPGAAAAQPLEIEGVGELTADKLRLMIDDWSGRPVERRAFQAVRVAYLVNRFVRASPAEPLALELQRTFPTTLKKESDAAMTSTPPRPALAVEFANGYLQLSFAPRDPELERRVYELGPKVHRNPGHRANRARE